MRILEARESGMSNFLWITQITKFVITFTIAVNNTSDCSIREYCFILVFVNIVYCLHKILNLGYYTSFSQ